MKNWLMNTWYMAAWAHEVVDQPLSRRLLGQQMLFYRKKNGAIAALLDRCAHRFAPLSKGTIVDDRVRCPYHGLVFDASGQCISAPLEETVPRALKVQSFPVVERDNIVWFWPGMPDAAESALIPNFSYLADADRYRHVYGLTHVHAHYELETDNLMDLSHVELLHAPFKGVLTKNSKYRAFREGNRVRSNWFSTDAQNPLSLEQGPFPTHGARIDQWLEMRWDPPGAMYLEVVVTLAGHPREAGLTMPGSHILTPETQQSTHYFWSGTLGAHEPVPLDLFRESFVQTFEHEDKPMIEDVAAAMGDETDLLSMKPVLLRSDAGAVYARRVLAELIAKERQGISPDRVVS